MFVLVGVFVIMMLLGCNVMKVEIYLILWWIGNIMCESVLFCWILLFICVIICVLFSCVVLVNGIN